MKRLWDISPPVCATSPLFPGDEPYAQRWTATIGPGCPVNLSAITLSPHTGAHADAPLHYGAGEPTIGTVDLDRCPPHGVWFDAGELASALKEAKHFRAEPKPHESLLHKLGKLLQID